MTTTKNHSACDHPATKSARAACRRATVVTHTKMIVVATFAFVRQARAQGHVNLIHRITLDEIAQERGFEPREWDQRLACRLVRDLANLMGEWELLAEEMLKVRD